MVKRRIPPFYRRRANLPASCERPYRISILTRFGTAMPPFMTFLFTIAAGMTAAGLLSSLYSLLANEPTTKLGTFVHYAVMVIAGPVVLAGNSTKSFRKKECSKTAYALAMALSVYWSFATGVFILSVIIALGA